MQRLHLLPKSEVYLFMLLLVFMFLDGLCFGKRCSSSLYRVFPTLLLILFVWILFLVVIMFVHVECRVAVVAVLMELMAAILLGVLVVQGENFFRHFFVLTCNVFFYWTEILLCVFFLSS